MHVGSIPKVPVSGFAGQWLFLHIQWKSVDYAIARSRNGWTIRTVSHFLRGSPDTRCFRTSPHFGNFAGKHPRTSSLLS